MIKKITSENGMVIVEATIVFPIMFLVIFFMLFAGNAFYQKCRVEAIINEIAIAGSAYCADPMLYNVEGEGIPDVEDVDVRPYRYLFGLFGGMDDMQGDVESKLNDRFEKLGTGLFSGMRPDFKKTPEVKFNSMFLYSTFSVDAEYDITIPVRMLFSSDYIALHVSSHVEMPVSDSPEFIRNIDMVEDYMQRYGIDDKIREIVDSVKKVFHIS